MSAGTYNIDIDQGSDYGVELTIEQDGVIRDLTNYSARAQARVSKTAEAVLFTFTCAINAPLTGKIQMALANAVTAAIPAGIISMIWRFTPREMRQ